MKRSIALLVPISIFAVGTAMLPQTEKPAEEVYKNISTFKGTPARDILPAMKFMTASLKVKCSFCHDPKNYSADTKPEKGAARKMVEMQRGINKNFFNGRNEVTCMSCHNGHSRPVGTPVLTGLTMRHTRFTTTLKPADLIKKYNDAIGGELKSVSMTGLSLDGPEDKGQPFEIVQAAPDRFLITEGTIKIGYDGTLTWHSVGDHSTTLSGDNAVSVQRMGRFFRGTKTFDRYANLTISGKEKIGDKNAIVVRGALTSDNITEELYFDETTGLLLRVATLTRSPIGAVPSYVDFSDYRTVGGVKVPFKIVTTSPEGDVNEVRFNSAKPNPAFDDKMFSPPAPKGS